MPRLDVGENFEAYAVGRVAVLGCPNGLNFSAIAQAMAIYGIEKDQDPCRYRDVFKKSLYYVASYLGKRSEDQTPGVIQHRTSGRGSRGGKGRRPIDGT